MTVWRVSNKAILGYALGKDDGTYDGKSVGAPFLTISKAVLSAAASGDTITINPTDAPASNPYKENTSAGNNGLNLNAITGIIIQTDQSLLANGNVILQAAAAGSRVLNIPTSAGAFVFNNITFDGENARNCIVPHAQTGSGMAFNGCTFTNTTGFNCIGSATGAGNVLFLDKCTFTNTVAVAVLSAGTSYATLSVTGCTFNNVGVSLQTIVCSTSLIVGDSGDGTHTVFNNTSGTSIGLNPSASWGGTISITNCQFNSVTNPIAWNTGGSLRVTNTTVTIAGNTFTTPTGQISINVVQAVITTLSVHDNVSTGVKGLISVNDENVVNVNVYNNTVTLTASANTDAIIVKLASGTVNLYNNTVNCAATSTLHCIAAGNDGYFVDSSNATATGTQNLGDLATNTFVDQSFTASTSVSRASKIAGCAVNLSKTGTPSGNITCKLYTNSGGNPTTLLETSPTLVAASSLTGTAQQFFFQFSSQSAMTSGTTYHLVFTYSGTINGTDYIVMQNNATVTGGSIKHSTDGTTWTADSTHALLYIINTGSFLMTASIYGNTITVTSAASAQIHGILLGTSNNPLLYRNIILGAQVNPIKDCTGGSAYDNLIYSATTLQAILYSKGSANLNIYHNTVILGSAGFALTLDSDPTLGVNAPGSTGNVVKNNIFTATTASGTAYAYRILANTIGVYPTGNTINNNLAYAGANALIESARYNTWAAWQTAGFDMASYNGGPVLRSMAPTVAAGFTPLADSPVISRGVNLLSAVPADYNSVPFTSTPTLGALASAGDQFGLCLSAGDEADLAL